MKFHENPAYSNIREELISLFRNATTLIQRKLQPGECGLATAAFGYWYLGFNYLSVAEQKISTYSFLHDSRFCVETLYRRLLAEKQLLTPVASMDLLDNYFEAQFQNTRSMLCGVYQPTIVLVESYLDTTSRHPFGCEWESMPKTAARDRTSLLLALHDAVAWLCSEPIAEAFAPEIVIRSKDGLDKYGQSISEGFHAKTR